VSEAAKLEGRFKRRERLQGAGLDLALPYLLLAPCVLIVLGVLVYPLWDGLRASTMLYRYGKPVANVGFDNYLQLWSDPQFLNSLWVTVRFVFFSVAIETVLGLALALFCLREFRGIRLLRTVLIVPMVITPVVVAIVFRLIYASDAGMFTAFSEAMGGGEVQILGDPTKAFIGLVALDVWEWTPLMFLILLAGLQTLPQEPFEAARVDGAGPWRSFVDLTLPMLRPVLAIAIVLRTIDAFGTFDQVFVLTHGGPGEATKLVSIYGYDTSFKFQQTGYAAALFVTIGLIILAFALAAVRLLRRAGPA
jgi:multiple sugar transport system permease protein